MNDQLERSASPAIVRIVRGVLRVALALLLLAPAQAFAINCNKNGCPGEGLCAKCCALTKQLCKGQAIACNCAYTATCPKTAGGACHYCTQAKAPPCGAKPKSCHKDGCKGRGCTQAICPTGTCGKAGGTLTPPCAQGTRECAAIPRCGPGQATCACCPNRSCGTQCALTCYSECGSGTMGGTNCQCCLECRSGLWIQGEIKCHGICPCCVNDNGDGWCPEPTGCAYTAG